MKKHHKILITGNMGYVGPVVEELLCKTMPEITLIGLDCGYFAHCLTGVDFLPETMISQQIFSDVRDITENMLEDVTGVVHLAAISNDPMGKYFEKATEEINHNATINIAQRAKASGVKSFVFASSCSIYGSADDKPRIEKSQLNPLTAYARSKVNSEIDLESLADDDFLVTCLRFPTASGMSQRLRLDLVLNDFVASALANAQIKVLSDGSPWRPLIDIRDMASAINWSLNRDFSKGGNFLTINAGRKDCNYQVRDIAYLVSEICGGVDVLINTNASPDNRSYKVNFDLFHNLTPPNILSHDLNSTIEKLVAGLKNISFNHKEFRNSQWMRLNILEEHRKKGLIDKNLRWRAKK